jgi:hypothetical protein
VKIFKDVKLKIYYIDEFSDSMGNGSHCPSLPIKGPHYVDDFLGHARRNRHVLSVKESREVGMTEAIKDLLSDMSKVFRIIHSGGSYPDVLNHCVECETLYDSEWNRLCRAPHEKSINSDGETIRKSPFFDIAEEDDIPIGVKWLDENGEEISETVHYIRQNGACCPYCLKDYVRTKMNTDPHKFLHTEYANKFNELLKELPVSFWDCYLPVKVNIE